MRSCPTAHAVDPDADIEVVSRHSAIVSRPVRFRRLANCRMR